MVIALPIARIPTGVAGSMSDSRGQQHRAAALLGLVAHHVPIYRRNVSITMMKSFSVRRGIDALVRWRQSVRIVHYLSCI